MKLQRIVGGLLLLLVWASASAAPIAYQFDIRWTGGALTGQTDTGLIIVDGNDCAGNLTCTGVFTPGSATRTLLEFAIDVDGRLFRHVHDLGFPSFPAITFSNLGLLTNIDYDGRLAGWGLTLLGGAATNFPVSAPAGPLRSFGLVGNIRRIPEPTSLALLGAALLVAPWLRRRVAGR